jgi:predicted TIM-barrel fold metal-dependent hydrolase
MFISHCHVGAVPFGLSNHPQAGTVELLLCILEKVGADGAGVFAPFPHPHLGWGGEAAQRYADPNEWLLAELEKWPQLRGFATLNPRDPDAPERLQRYVAAGLVGVKVHPPVHGITLNDPALEPFWSAAEELAIPVHVHTGAHGRLLKTYQPLLLDEVAHAHPKLNIIMEHVGGYAFFHEALAVLNNNPNVYAGITQASGRAPLYEIPLERIQVLLKNVGAQRLIYGLDYPWNPDNEQAIVDDLRWVRSWGLSREETEAILGGNMLRLITRS